MPLPLTKEPLLAYFDVSNGIYSRSGNQGISSLLNEVNGLGATQSVSIFCPIFNSTAFNHLPSMDFTGSQYLSYNRIGGTISGDTNSFTICLVASCRDPASGTALAMIGLGNSTSGNTKTYLSVSSEDVSVIAANDSNSGSTSNGGITLDTAAHCYTIIKNGTELTVRQDGIQIINVSGLSGTYTYDTVTIGAFNSNGSVSKNWKGSIGPVAIYMGVAGVNNVEAFMMERFC